MSSTSVADARHAQAITGLHELVSEQARGLQRITDNLLGSVCNASLQFESKLQHLEKENDYLRRLLADASIQVPALAPEKKEHAETRMKSSQAESLAKGASQTEPRARSRSPQPFLGDSEDATRHPLGLPSSDNLEVPALAPQRPLTPIVPPTEPVEPLCLLDKSSVKSQHRGRTAAEGSANVDTSSSKIRHTVDEHDPSDSSVAPDEPDHGKTDKPRAVFADPDALREKVREALLKPDYSVTMYYHETGLAQYIARALWFEQGTMFVIFLNSIWISVEMDLNEATILSEAEPQFQIIEHLFCAYFFFEWMSRFLAFKNKLDGRKDGWFVFDTILVTTMVVETWLLTIVLALVSSGSQAGLGDATILRLARNFRLTRAVRIARLLRSVPELLVLLKGMLLGFRAVFFTIVLMALFIYLFAIVFAQLSEGTELAETHFKSVPSCMYVLLTGGVLADQESLIADLNATSPLYAVLFVVYFLVVVLTVLNMLLGVLVDVVNVVSKVEKDQASMADVKSRVMKIFQLNKGDEESMISFAFFHQVLSDTDCAYELSKAGIDTLALVDQVDEFFGDAHEVPFTLVLDTMLSLIGGEAAKKSDICDLRKFIQTELRKAAAVQDDLLERCNSFIPVGQTSSTTSKAVSKTLSTPSSPTRRALLS